MIETIKVNINGQVYNYSKDITINEIYKEHQSKYRYPIILAKVNGRLKELSSKLTDDSTIEFVDLTVKEGNRVHVNGLIFVLQYAVKKLYGPGANILVQHSLDKGVYIQTTFKLTEEKLENGSERIVMKLKKHLAPIKIAIVPLKKNSEAIMAKCHELKKNLMKLGIGRVALENTGNIGKAYRRHDEIGTPLCLTVDFDTIEQSPETVTLRDRDTMEQIRIETKDLPTYLREYFA